tara:strand:- start:3692 stop:4165 length:474 start_codon:yes stop_codon:yes gene_type:complete
MMKKTYIFVIIFFYACSSDDLSEDQERANEIWDEMSGYQSWGQISDFSGIQSSNSAHGSYVQVWINEIAESFLSDSTSSGQLPNGSLIVKEGYSDSNGSDISKITIMKKIEGYDSNNNNWFWANYNSGGSLAGKNGKETSCYNCHASGQDYLLSTTW